MKYDLIIVAKSSRPDLIKMTQKAIDSSKTEGEVNVILVETGFAVKYNNVDKTVFFSDPFNYNKALNLGLTQAEGDVYILANNDVIFYEGWSIIGPQMILNGFDSACGLSSDKRQKCFERGDWVYEGYNIGRELVGWCIFLTKEGYKKIGQLDESVEFWYSDNVYADQLKEAGLRHGLFCNVFIDHLESRTLKTVSRRLQRQYSMISGISYVKRKRVHQGNT